MAKINWISADIDWLETKLAEMKQYVDNNPLGSLKDRTEIVMSAKGTPVIKIIKDKEGQSKELRSILREIVSMLPEINKLRQLKEEAELEIRGGGSVNGMMRTKLNT